MDSQLFRPRSLYKNRTPSKSAHEEANLRKKVLTQLNMQGDDEKTKHPVRIPIYFSQNFNKNPITQIRSYLYCYSALPQSHWVSRGTFVCLSDH